MYKEDAGTPDGFHTTGVWTLISKINHSCVSNCYRSFIGDIQIVRATKDLEPGSELFFWYRNPESFHTYKETQNHLRSWGFSCACALCLARKKMTKTTLDQRKIFWEKIQHITNDLVNDLGPTGGKLRPSSVKKTKTLFQQMEATYSVDERAPGAVRLELWGLYIRSSQALCRNGNYAEAIEMAVRGLEALGFIVIACPPRPNATPHEVSAKFHVQQWGLADEPLVVVFSILYTAYKVVAPELVAVVKKYAETAYSIIAGEKDTILERHPELV